EPQRKALCSFDVERLERVERDELLRLALRVAMTHPPSWVCVINSHAPLPVPPVRRSLIKSVAAPAAVPIPARAVARLAPPRPEEEPSRLRSCRATRSAPRPASCRPTLRAAAESRFHIRHRAARAAPCLAAAPFPSAP